MIDFNSIPYQEIAHFQGGEGSFFAKMTDDGLNRILHGRLEPGCSIGYHVHEGEAELFYFVEGTGRVQDDDKIIDVKAGDSMATFSGHGHSVENTGDVDLVLVAAIVLD